jgi:elongation factor G
MKIESLYHEGIETQLEDGQVFGENIQIDIKDDLIPNSTNRLFPTNSEIKSAVISGINAAISCGPLLGFPVSNIQVTLRDLELVRPETSTVSAIRAAAQTCVSKLIKTAQTRPLEPIMDLKIVVPAQFIGKVTSDITGHRRGNIIDLEYVDSSAVIICTAPLSELIGYVSHLRGLTAGGGEFSMELKGYYIVPAKKQEAIVQSIRGY